MKTFNFSYDEIYDLYITKNLRKKEIAEIYKCSVSALDRFLAKHNVRKSMEKQVECRRRGCLEKYGVDNPSKVNVIKQKKIDTCRKNYGVAYNFQSKELREKWKETLKEKYGVEYISQSAEIQEKIKRTNLEKYGVERYVNPEKAVQTNLEKYGVESPLQVEEFKKKSRETNLAKYGFEYASQSEEVKNKMKKANLERFGVEYACQSPEIKKKVKQTNLERHGNEVYTRTKEYRDKTRETCLRKYGFEHFSTSPSTREKVKKTYIEKYGVEHTSQLESVKNKIMETKKKNNSFHISKPEAKIKTLLESKYPNVKHQHYSTEYPFLCDFFIPEKNLYIEYQGTWVHGERPFDSEKIECVKQLEEWQKRAETSEFYRKAIKVWTQQDVLKRKTARENKLNWIEFFSMEEFLQWYENERV